MSRVSFQNLPEEGVGNAKFRKQIALLKELGVKEFRDSAGVTIVFFDPADQPQPKTQEKKR